MSTYLGKIHIVIHDSNKLLPPNVDVKKELENHNTFFDLCLYGLPQSILLHVMGITLQDHISIWMIVVVWVAWPLLSFSINNCELHGLYYLSPSTIVSTSTFSNDDSCTCWVDHIVEDGVKFKKFV